MARVKWQDSEDKRGWLEYTKSLSALTGGDSYPEVGAKSPSWDRAHTVNCITIGVIMPIGRREFIVKQMELE